MRRKKQMEPSHCRHSTCHRCRRLLHNPHFKNRLGILCKRIHLCRLSKVATHRHHTLRCPRPASRSPHQSPRESVLALHLYQSFGLSGMVILFFKPFTTEATYVIQIKIRRLQYCTIAILSNLLWSIRIPIKTPAENKQYQNYYSLYSFIFFHIRYSKFIFYPFYFTLNGAQDQR